MGHLLDHGADLEGEDLLHFARDQHAGDSDQVDVLRGELSLGLAEERVHQLHRNKKSVGLATERGEHLDHPVHHLGSHLFVDFVSAEEGVPQRSASTLQLVFEDVFKVVLFDLLGFPQNESIFKFLRVFYFRLFLLGLNHQTLRKAVFLQDAEGLQAFHHEFLLSEGLWLFVDKSFLQRSVSKHA